jgi:hypothetical protein
MKPRYLGLTLLALLTAGCDVYSRHATTRFDVGGHVRDVAAYKDTLVAVTDVSLLTYDISAPESPHALRVVALGRRANCLIVIDGIAYVGTDSGIAVCPVAGGTEAELHCSGASQAVAGLTADSTRLFAATGDGVTVFTLATPESTRFIPMVGGPTGVARHDSRLFVSLDDWGVRVLNILPGDSFALDTVHLGGHTRAEGVTVSSGGYCIIPQGTSGVLTQYTPAPDSFPFGGGGGGDGRSAYAAAATDGVEQAAFYLADSSAVTFTKIINRPGTVSFGEEIGPDLEGFTRRICVGGNGYVYTASGDAGIYIIRE